MTSPHTGVRVRRARAGGWLVLSSGDATSPLAVDVNEDNDQARRFYEALGFSEVGRSPVDAGGRPFPIIHMKRPARPHP